MLNHHLLATFIAKHAKGHQIGNPDLRVARERYLALVTMSEGARDYVVRERLEPFKTKAQEAQRLFCQRYPDAKVEKYETDEEFDFYIWIEEHRYLRGIADTTEVNVVFDGLGGRTYLAMKRMPSCYSKSNPTSADLAYYRQWLNIATDVDEGVAGWVVAANEAALLDRRIKVEISKEERHDKDSLLYKADQDRMLGKTQADLATVIDLVLGADHEDKGRDFWRDLAQAIFGNAAPKAATKKEIERLRAAMLA